MALIAACQGGDTAAMAELAKDNLGLVRAAMKRFAGADEEELFQAGCLGLVEAIRRFDVGRGTQFSSYAVPYILGEMRRFVRQNHSLHVPRSMQSLAAAAYRAAERLRRGLGREPSLTEIAGELGESAEELAMALSSHQAPLSLEAPLGEEGETCLAETLDDARQQRPFERFLLLDMLETCEGRERALLGLRYEQGLSQEDTALRLGISQSQVSRLEKRALGMLRASEGGEKLRIAH